MHLTDDFLEKSSFYLKTKYIKLPIKTLPTEGAKVANTKTN